MIQIKDLQRVELGPDDVLVIRLDQPTVGASQVQGINHAIKRTLGPGTKCLVVPSTFEMFVVGKGEIDGKCFCGSDALGSPKHSEYCPKYVKEEV